MNSFCLKQFEFCLNWLLYRIVIFVLSNVIQNLKCFKVNTKNSGGKLKKKQWNVKNERNFNYGSFILKHDFIVIIFFYVFLQNYFRDPWNVFDFITVVGSIVDVLISFISIGVSKRSPGPSTCVIFIHLCVYVFSPWLNCF